MAVFGSRGILNLLMYLLFEGYYLAPVCRRNRAHYSGNFLYFLAHGSFTIQVLVFLDLNGIFFTPIDREGC